MRARKAFYELHKPEKTKLKEKLKQHTKIIKAKHSGAKYLKTNKLPKDSEREIVKMSKARFHGRYGEKNCLQP